MTPTSGSSPKYSIISASETSISFPMLAKRQNPIFDSIMRSTTPPKMAPDWEIKAMVPFSGMPLIKVALSPVFIFITPTQFGPMMRMPCSLANLRTWLSRAAPAPPTSLNPLVMMTAFLMPRSAHSCKVVSVISTGRTIIAKSTGSGTEATLI